MNVSARLLVLLIMSISLTAPAGATVPAIDVDGFCGAIADDDDKKTDGDTKSEAEEEPECD